MQFLCKFGPHFTKWHNFNKVTLTHARGIVVSQAEINKPSVKRVNTEAELNTPIAEPLWRRRLLFRCKNRGIKELDLLIGKWAERNIDNLSVKQLTELQDVLQEVSFRLFSF